MSDENTEAAAPEVVDQPDNEAEAPGAPDQAEQSSGPESFTDFDPSEIPESGASPEWLKERHDQMQKQWTQKNMEFGDKLRNLDQLQTIIDTLRQGDPEQRRATATMLGLTEDDVLQMYNLEKAEQEAAEEEAVAPDQDFDEFNRDPRVDRIIAREEAEAQAKAEQDAKAEADQVADEVGSEMEDELTKAFDGKLPADDIQEWIFARAVDNPDQFGKPDVLGAVQKWNKILDDQRQEWLASRQGPRAATQGIPGSERFDTSTKEGREALALMGVQEANSSR